jgi:sensor domain CHASE-containing protein
VTKTVSAILVAVLLTTAATLGGVALMLQSFGDSLDRELEEEVDVVQRDVDRDFRRLERRLEEELDRRLPAPALP